MYSNISADIRSWSDSSTELIFSISCLLIIIDLLSDLSPLSASLQVSVNMFPSSNYAKVITSPVCSFKDVTYGVYVTARRIAIASEYGCDVYANALENFRQIQHLMKILSLLYRVRTQDIHFGALESQQS